MSIEQKARQIALQIANEACRNMDGEYDLEAAARHIEAALRPTVGAGDGEEAFKAGYAAALSDRNIDWTFLDIESAYASYHVEGSSQPSEPTPAIAGEVTVERGWLIEHTASSPDGPTWLFFEPPLRDLMLARPWMAFTKDANAALRFGRKGDAEAVLKMLRMDGLDWLVATEHQWLDTQALASKSPPAPVEGEVVQYRDPMGIIREVSTIDDLRKAWCDITENSRTWIVAKRFFRRIGLIEENERIASIAPARGVVMGGRTIKRAVALHLIAAIYKAEGWKPTLGERRVARCNALYDITADPRTSRYIAKRKCAPSPEDRDERYDQ